MTPDPALGKPEHACPVCGDKQHISLLCRVDGADVYSCATCTADHVFPMPTERALKAYYDRREWFEGGEKGGYENYDSQTAWSIDLLEPILAPFAGRAGLSILDVGCGYGSHLAAAAKRGWKCFGVEPSTHARAVAQQRLGGSAYVVEAITDLIPHEFDVVLLFDVIEHLRSPYPSFYQLFSIGAITAKTVVVITTPNAGSTEAERDPATWPYRHPASHLTHYSAGALAYLFKRLRFPKLEIRGTGPGDRDSGDLLGCAGLLATASGSDFTEFMRERYVPGTWSKIAEYEHIPRYALAKPLAANKVVLDFGCGTGYGAAIMAETADRVLGLDIDSAALVWAGDSHRNSRLSFSRHDDLGATLPDASFDLVTCFEMIEHVNHQTQKAAVASIARLLRDDGLLIISTPNPDVTALYGANPYHLREMSEAEFRELLNPHFAHILVLRQYIHVGVAIGHDDTDASLAPGRITSEGQATTKPLAFIALCSRRPISRLEGRILFDLNADYIQEFMLKEQAINKARLDAYLQGELAQSATSQLSGAISERDTAQTRLQDTTDRLIGREKELIAHQIENARLARAYDEANAARQTKVNELATLETVRRDELSSPRFLSRQLWHATHARIGAILRARFSRHTGQ